MSFNVGPRTISATGGSIKRVGNYRVHTFPSELVTDGLVLNLDAGDPRSYPGSGTSWTDLSGNGNTATGVGTAMPSYNNANGGSLVFDGVNDYIIRTTPSSLNFGTLDFSVFCWIKCTKKGAGTYGTPVTLDVDGTGSGILFYIDGSSGIFRTWVNGQALNGSIDVADNQWHYIGIVKFGTTATQFVDGVHRSSFACSSSLISSPNLILGNYRTTPEITYAYNGNLSQVTIHSRPLSAAEVAQNYDALKVRYTSYTNTFTPLCGGGSGKVEVLCVAGGGGGGKGTSGGGGGAGGLLYNSAFTVNSNTGIGITVGAGGTGTTADTTQATNGGNSIFSALTSIGGGYGGNEQGATPSMRNGNSGGSGGGGSYHGNGSSGTTGQGNSGGNGTSGGNRWTGGGGGGAGSSGASATAYYGGDGGSGLAYSISGTSSYYAGGGGGAAQSQGGGTVYGGNGGLGGGGAGPADQTASQVLPGVSGIPNTGGGGSGGVDSLSVSSGNGSNGIVIVRYPATDYNVELLIVGGGGGSGFSVGSGGGAGGLLYYSSYPVSAGTKYAITVGSGSTAMTVGGTGVAASNGNNSIFGPLVAYGGGGGTGQSVAYPNGPGGKSGGSGSGGTRNQNTPGQGVTGQGNAGGRGSDTAGSYGGGGGGGAGAVGGDGSGTGGGAGGNGLAFSISGISTYYAGGGGGSSNGGPEGAGGLGGGGAGTSGNGTSAVANTGGGGGGGDTFNGGTIGGNGGSGIIIIAYQGPQRGLGGTVDTTSRPGYTLHTFTTTGTDFFIP
jgi:hypothetical protein